MYDKPAAPASIGGVLDNGFKLLRSSFGKVIGISVLASLISQIPGLMMTASLGPDGLPQVDGALMIAVAVSMLCSLIIYGAVIGRINSVHEGREMTLGESLGLGLSCMLPLLGFWLLYVIAVGIGTILLIVPGMILALSLMFGSYILIIDRAGVIESLKQSHNLVWGYWWRTAAVVTVAGIIVIVGYVLVGFVAGIAVAVDPDSATSGAFSLTQTVLTALLGGILTPVGYALTLATFYDLRLRREGGDLASRIEAAPSAA